MPRWKSAKVQYHFFLKTRRLIDADNAISSMKAGLDGIVRAGVLEDDDRITMFPVIMDFDKENPRVEVSIEKSE